MNENSISLAFVAVFAQPLSVLPVPDNDFCKQLFGNPNETYHGMTPEGYLIAIKNKPVPLVIISPVKIMVKAQSIEDLTDYIVDLSKLFAQKGIEINYNAYGVNGEYQWLNLSSGAADWMWKRFVNPSMEIIPEGNQCTKISFRFFEGVDESINIDVEPRNGIHDGIFVSVNHHHERGGQNLPSKEDLIQMFGHTRSLLENKYFKKIITD